MSELVKGQCRCGKLQMHVSGPPLITMACHCTGCQRMSASAFSLSALFFASAFEVIRGEPSVGGIGGPTRHFFCPSCMSWLYTCPEGMDELVNVRSTMFESLADTPPFIETWTVEALKWPAIGATHSFERLPGTDEFPDLMQEFSERNVRKG